MKGLLIFVVILFGSGERTDLQVPTDICDNQHVTEVMNSVMTDIVFAPNTEHIAAIEASCQGEHLGVDNKMWWRDKVVDNTKE